MFPVPEAAPQPVVTAVTEPATNTVQVHVAPAALNTLALRVSATVTDAATAGPELFTVMV